MMQEVEVLKTIQELICSFFSEEQFTLSFDHSDFTFPVPRGKMGVDEQHRQSQLQVPKGRR